MFQAGYNPVGAICQIALLRTPVSSPKGFFMNTLSFMTANFVARQVGYHMTEGWGQGDRATYEYFRPIETFPARFEEYMTDAKNMGFSAVDIWMPLLHPDWATDEHVAAAQEILKRHNLQVVSLAAWLADDPAYVEKVCKLAVALGTDVIGGGAPILKDHRDTVVSILKNYGVRLGIENHPERNAEELLAQVGDTGDGTIGLAVDTGWFGTHGFDAVTALEAVAPHLFHIHLKDVRAVGGHDTCRYGEGVVPIRDCVETLQRIGYTGAISIEHEPDDHDPTEDVIASLEMVEAWLS